MHFLCEIKRKKTDHRRTINYSLVRRPLKGHGKLLVNAVNGTFISLCEAMIEFLVRSEIRKETLC